MPDQQTRVTLRLPIAAEPGSDPVTILDLARRAEACGFTAVSLSDHVVMGAHADRYPWGEFPFPPEAPWYEPLSLLAAIAGATTRLRLTTGILIVPLRSAALLAKWVATVDVLSGGRLELGVGTGWQREEFDALGLPYALRGQMLTDTIGACRALWSSSPASFRSETVTFEDIWCDPKPVRRGGPPILFSGTLTDRNKRRIVDLGDGWIPIMGERRPGIAAGVQELRALFETAGRDPDTLLVRSTARMGATVSETFERSQALVEVGVNDIDLPLTAFPDLDADQFFADARTALKETGWSAS
ncbi:MAG TPA: TIGR03619 family F420-dependent LLM class oxidoreductase [Acidimicrobiales bacterium]|nr:TIGR03619 family F420-dependent LLM class oxidoreductase [Acidimicrobiales bacterium]